jgi:threonylcarbamoyladenosine tRNA methylthiotransferase MtaB
MRCDSLQKTLLVKRKHYSTTTAMVNQSSHLHTKIMKNKVVNFGCRLNAYESQIIRQELNEHQLSDLTVFNSCAVTAEAERQVRQAIRKEKRQHPDRKIIVTGCAAQINPQQFTNMEEVSFVMGNQLKTQGEIYKRVHHDLNAGTLDSKTLTTDIMQSYELPDNQLVSFEDYNRAFIQIQNGCDHRCTFCTIPYGRGNSKSVHPERIIREIRHMVQQQYREIVLTGVDLTDYGKGLDIDINLGSLCQQILSKIPQLPRLRVSSVDVAEIDKQMMDLIAQEPRFMPYLHISIQSGDNMILKRMKRRHSREDVLRFCHEVRSLRPEITFGSDIIAGFPTETDNMFDNTRALLQEANIIFNHIFTYSARPNTPAARMPQVPLEIRKQRTATLIEDTKKMLQRFLSTQIGKVHSIILESDDTGRTENFLPVKIIGANLRQDAVGGTQENIRGKIIPVEITASENQVLMAKILN